MRKQFNWLAFLLALLACNESFEENVPSDDKLYFPLQVGNEWVYEQTHIQYEISGFDTTILEVKEIVTSESEVDEYINYTIERSSRANSDEEWSIDSIYVIRRSELLLLTQINNQTHTTLSFPVVENKKWDFNSHNNGTEYLVSYENVSEQLLTSFGDLIGSDPLAISVSISDYPQDFVRQDERYEVYVKGVGLIEKKSIILEFCQQQCDSAGQIYSGYFLRKQLKSYAVQ